MMKLIITTLTMIFISFGANSMTVGKTYNICLPYKSNGFDLNKMSKEHLIMASTCIGLFRGVTSLGHKNCSVFGALLNQDLLINKRTLKLFKEQLSNRYVSDIKAVIISFINFAEKNPQYWEEDFLEYADLFISSKFPCDLKKP